MAQSKRLPPPHVYVRPIKIHSILYRQSKTCRQGTTNMIHWHILIEPHRDTNAKWRPREGMYSSFTLKITLTPTPQKFTISPSIHSPNYSVQYKKIATQPHLHHLPSIIAGNTQIHTRISNHKIIRHTNWKTKLYNVSKYLRKYQSIAPQDSLHLQMEP